MKKRLFSLLLVLVMVLGMFPVTAFAAEAPVSVTADGETVTVSHQGDYSDAQWGWYTIPVYYAQVSEDATVSIICSSDAEATYRPSDGYLGYLSELQGMTKDSLQPYFTTASNYGLTTANNVAYIEILDYYYGSIYGVLIELVPASASTTTYEVTLPSGEGYTAAASGDSASPVEEGGSYSFTVTVSDDYDDTNMVVKANDTVLTADNGVYTIENITAKQTITVTGLEPIDVSPAEPSVKLTGITGEASSTNETEDADVSNAFDGDYGTYWATAAGGSLEDSYLIAELGDTYTINKVEYTKRYDSNAQYNCTGNLLNYVIEVSTDGETWNKVAEGNTIDGTTVIEFNPVQAAYVRLTSTSSYHWDSAQTNTVMCAAELAVFKTEAGDTDTTYTVDLPTGEGYVAEAYGDSVSPVEEGGSYSFTVKAADGYDGTNMVVKTNDTELTASAEGVYTITNIQADQTVTVTGVEKFFISVTADGEECALTVHGNYQCSASNFTNEIPVYKVSANEGAAIVINKLADDGDDDNGINADMRAVYMYDGTGARGSYPISVDSGYAVGDDAKEKFGLTTTNTVYYIEIGALRARTPLYGLLVEMIPAAVTAYTVTLPSGEGYTAAASGDSASPVEAGGSYSFTVTVADGYEKTADFAVKANDEPLTATDDVYTISNITADQVITVSGVEKKAVPLISVTVDGEASELTTLGTYQSSIYRKTTEIPVYMTSAGEGKTIVISKGTNGDGSSGNYRFAYKYGASSGDEVTYTNFSVGSDYIAGDAAKTKFGLNTANTVYYVEVTSYSDGTPLYGLVVEVIPAAPADTYTVTLPTGEGYSAAASGDSASPVEAGGSYSFTVAVVYGYDGTNMVVKANDTVLTADDGVYTIENITADQDVTVSGVTKTVQTDPSDYITVSVEKYDADGNCTFLMEPARTAYDEYKTKYVIDALRMVMGGSQYSDKVKCESTYENSVTTWFVTGIYDETQSDSYLNNGDIEGYKWQVLVDNEPWSGTHYNKNYALTGGEVLRCIYTGEAVEDVAGGVSKDDLIRLAADVSDEIKTTQAYKDALDTIVSDTATEEDVQNAITALQNAAVVKATSVEITAGESVDLKVNSSLTLQAAILPANATDVPVWSSSDSGIVSVDTATGEITGVSAGEATVTATCGSVSDSIEVHVTAVEAESVTITNGDVSVEARFSIQLTATITPENSTELVVWSVADESIATVDANGKLTGVLPGTTTVTATAGAVSHTVNVTVTETTSTYVYFQYTDGRVQEMKEDSFTLTVLDEGSFVVGNTTAAATWSCSEYVSNDDGTNQYNYWISSDGKYQPHGAKDMTAYVNAGGFNKTFTIKTVPSGISQVKVYIDDQERNAENPYSVTGMATTWITVNGLNEAGEWVYIPIQAVEINSSDTNIARFLGNQMSLIREGSANITISMLDNSAVSTSFEAICNTVKVTGIDVHVPEVFTIDKWDSMGNVFVGIYQGYDNPNTQYYVYYTPSNATNQDLIWEDLTPEIAEYDEGWSTGIVPQKAGTAKFKVTSASNPEVSQEVTIKFEYKTPLESVECPQETFEMAVGDSVDPGLIFTPGNATETRFNWTYSQNGIVQVKETVTSSGYDRVVNRKIIALANGTVTVTGTPVDDTAGCPSVTFTVTVGGSGQTEDIDYLKMAKEDIAHGLEYLQEQNQTSYGNEWTIFTNLRAGGYMDPQLRIIYLQSIADELKNYTEDKQPTDYARVVLTLPLLDADPENLEGLDLVEKLYNANLENQTSNQVCWTLLALDSRDYEIPEDAKWNRDKLIAKILTFQNADGSFALYADGSGDVDMTGMILQSLAPYYDSNAQVRSAVNKALEYLKNQMNENVGYISGGAENACTAAQVLTALAALRIDPTDPDNGFTLGTKNLITNLHTFLKDSGFAYLLGGDTNLMGTQQTTYALEAYRRWAEGQNALYDLTDLDGETEIVTYEVTLPTGEGYTAEAADGSESPVVTGGRYSFTVTLADGYTKDESFAVKANGVALTEAEGKYTIKNIRADQVVTIEGVRKALENETFTVSLPSGEGYVVKAADGSKSPVEYDGSYSFTVTIAEGYEKTDGFAVKVNGTTLTESNGKYTIENIRSNQTVTVTGVKQKADTITVRFSLLGCYKHSDGETAVHTLVDGNLQSWIKAKEYEVPADSTVKDILETVLSQNGMTAVNPTGNYVKAIVKGGVRIGEFTNGTYSGWMYTLNGTHPNLGVAEQKVKNGDVIIFHYTDDYTREDGSQGNDDRDEEAAEKVEKLIDAIGTVTLNSADEIEAARKAYNALTYAQKQLVDNYATLTAAESKYDKLKAEDDEKKASDVEDLIDEIDSDSVAFEDDVKAAQKAYNNLTADQKKLVDNYYKLVNYQKELADEEDKEAAEAVETLIEELGTITLDSEEDIKAAREAYEKLTDEQKALVENLAALEAAEEKLAELKALADVADIYRTTGDYLENLGTPVPGSVGGEWMVIGLSRSGREVPGVDEYYDSVVKYVQENIDENERLHSAKSTDNARMILALTAIGKDVTNVDGHNLLTGLNSMEFIQKQGINGPIWALMAFDSGNYPVPEGDVSREALIRTILDAQLADGGWALSGDTSDADMTGMAVQALAPYYNTNADVKKALDKAVETMSMMQTADGSFGSIDGVSSESISQIIVALAALGIDADKDERFTKNGVSAVDALCAFYVDGGGFRHIPDGKLDGMATEQGYYALTAYFRMLDGKTGLYNMTDVVDMGGDAEVAEPTETLPVETEPAPTEPADTQESKGGFPWWIIIVILVAGAATVVIVNRKKIFANVR